MADDKLNYQKLNDELELILDKLQSGELDIDETLKHYERGMNIVKQLETYLKQSENKISKVKKKFTS